jgi:hypothetical protein
MRGALQKLLHIADTMQRGADDALIIRRERSLAGELIDVIAEGRSSGDTPCGCMRLLQQSNVGEIGHHVADGGGTEALAAMTRQSARTDRLARRDVSLDNGGQNFAFPRPDLAYLRHPNVFRCRRLDIVSLR